MAENSKEGSTNEGISTKNTKDSSKAKITPKNVSPQIANVQPAEQPQQAAEQPARGGNLSIFKLVFYYWIINQVIGFFFSGNQKGSSPLLFSNVFENNEPFEIYYELSRVPFLNMNKTNILTSWSETELFYNFNISNYREKFFVFNKTELLEMKNLYINMLVSSTRNTTLINETDLIPYLTFQGSYNLIDNRPKTKFDEETALLWDESAPLIKKNINKSELFPHLRNKSYVNLVHDSNSYAKNQIPPQMNIKLIEQFHIYQPILDTKQFWIQNKDYIVLDEAQNETLNISISFNTYWSYKYMLESQMQESTKIYSEWGMDSNMEEMKEMFLETNIYLLSVTMVVSLLHSIFEILAMKNDFQFWKNVESHKGLSLRSLYVTFFVDVVQLLYLLDNDTSSMILIFCFLSIGLTIWKIMKTTKFKWREDKKFPWVELDHQESYKRGTEEYDKTATKYLLRAMIPLMIGYFIYSLIYEKYKGWYSFILSTTMGFIYVFGFINMTPQIYINYKMKSVAHLPWRTLVYHFLNTIIDDLFAFIITMPWLKRLSCFRDDVIFVIYLYQRWIYRVDYKRMEGGFMETETIAENLEQKEQNQIKNSSEIDKNAKQKPIENPPENNTDKNKTE